MSVTKLTSPKTKSLITTLKILNLFEEVNGFIQSNYITTLKEQAILNQKMKSERGKLAAQARWNKSSSNADASDSECSSNAQALLKECPSPSPLPLPLPSSSSSSSSSSQRKDDKNEEKPINRKWI
ncbi:hypothetical protein J550_2515 [Acinetobacter sp. 230853]|nr:hypothetical protein J550_2515 [Acinetobacter sp. 230853]